jgi:hypothetical protein
LEPEKKKRVKTLPFISNCNFFLPTCTSKQVAKNEFRHINIVLLVHDDRYSVSIVPNRDLVCISADFNLDTKP